MSKLDKDQVIAAFTEAYSAAKGKAPTIEVKAGWYSVDGGKNMRLADLHAMIAELATPTSAKKIKTAADKPTKVAQKKAAKAPLKKNVKKSDFSVKEFWAQTVLQQNTGSKLPR